ncbi:MAG TPA: hypothetical protein GX715_15515, partial [Armatimonadetes bacterium]|nr:hypothetical protein [Armatimonadota bacterium]
MKIFDSMPFAKELLAPTTSESFRRPGVQARPGEVILDGGWSIAVECDDPLTRTAGEHLARFLTDALGVTLASGAAAKSIRL